MPENQTSQDVQNSGIRVDGVELQIDGQGPQALVMIHGWPDTWRLWDAQVEHFAPRFRCVRFTLPGFDIDGPRRGHSLDQIIAFIGRVLDAVSPGQPVVLMLHDWGCHFGYQFALRHPGRVLRVIGIDVGDAHSREFRQGLSLRDGLLIAGYQLWLMLAWRLGQLGLVRLGDRMTRWMARAMHCRSDPARIGSCMNYPYDITWTGSHGGYRQLKALDPPWPLFFAWGQKTPVRFHSLPWRERLLRDPRHVAQPFDCGHWVMCSRGAEFNQAVDDWLSRPLER